MATWLEIQAALQARIDEAKAARLQAACSMLATGVSGFADRLLIMDDEQGPATMATALRAVADHIETNSALPSTQALVQLAGTSFDQFIDEAIMAAVEASMESYTVPEEIAVPEEPAP